MEDFFSDILQVTDFLKLRGLLVTVDIQKAFDPVNHLFYNHIKEYSFGEGFVKWIQILLRTQQSCIINGETTKKYFKLEKMYKKRRLNFCLFIYSCFRKSFPLD